MARFISTAPKKPKRSKVIIFLNVTEAESGAFCHLYLHASSPPRFCSQTARILSTTSGIVRSEESTREVKTSRPLPNTRTLRSGKAPMKTSEIPKKRMSRAAAWRRRKPGPGSTVLRSQRSTSSLRDDR